LYVYDYFILKVENSWINKHPRTTNRSPKAPHIR
jgi:hypothetical protein